MRLRRTQGGLRGMRGRGGRSDEGERPTDYHKVLLRRLEAVRAAVAEEAGAFEARCFVDTGPVVERVYARYAGLGWTGKNTCLLNQELGSWLFLGVMVTSLELPRGAAGVGAGCPDRCGSCTRCLDACPTGALTGPRQMDANLCISYLTIEKRGEIPEGLRSGSGAAGVWVRHLPGRLPVEPEGADRGGSGTGGAGGAGESGAGVAGGDG